MILHSGIGITASFVIAFCIYFLPSLIGRKKRAANAIFVLNLLLGWTGIGWLICLIWSLIRDPAPVVIYSENPNVQHQSRPIDRN